MHLASRIYFEDFHSQDTNDGMNVHLYFNYQFHLCVYMQRALLLKMTSQISKKTTTQKGVQYVNKDELQALTEAMGYLTIIISSPHDDEKEIQADAAIDQLLQNWKLEHTGFPRLYNTAKQMKQHLRLTAMEADSHIADMNIAHQSTIKAREKNDKLKKIIVKTASENDKLRNENALLVSEIRSRKKEMKLIVRSIRNYFNQSEYENEEKETISESDDGTYLSMASSLVTDYGCATLRLEEKKRTRFQWLLP